MEKETHPREEMIAKFRSSEQAEFRNCICHENSLFAWTQEHELFSMHSCRQNNLHFPSKYLAL